MTQFSPTGSYDYCGHSSAIGDLDGDGYDDIAIGCPYFASTTGLMGLVYGSVSPSSEVDLMSAELAVQGDALIGSELAASIAMTDITGDGQLDLVIGEPRASVATSTYSEGRAAFFDGAGLSSGYLLSSYADGFVIGAQSGGAARGGRWRGARRAPRRGSGAWGR